MTKDFKVLAKCQSKFLFKISDGMKLTKNEEENGICFRVNKYWPPFYYTNYYKQFYWIYDFTLFIPIAYRQNFVFLLNLIHLRNKCSSNEAKENEANDNNITIIMREAKFVLAFTEHSCSRLESGISNIFSMRDNRPLPICIIVPNNTFNKYQSYGDKCLIFYGSNIEVSTFLVKTEDEIVLRKKLLEWKHGLRFLRTHNIIAFHIMENETLAIDGTIFRKIFDIEPFSMKVTSRPNKNLLKYAEMNDETL
ncbi:Acetate kinase [Dirofilaria immitis]